MYAVFKESKRLSKIYSNMSEAIQYADLYNKESELRIKKKVANIYDTGIVANEIWLTSTVKKSLC